MRRETQYRAIFVTMMAIALWHDLSLPLIVFGLYHSCGLVGARLLNQVLAGRAGAVGTPLDGQGVGVPLRRREPSDVDAAVQPKLGGFYESLIGIR